MDSDQSDSFNVDSGSIGTRRSRKKKLKATDINSILEDGGTREALPANILLSPMFDVIKDKDGNSIVMICKKCDSIYGKDSKTSAATHVKNKHPDSVDFIVKDGELVKSKIANLLATVAITTHVPFSLFETPAFLDALDQFAALAICLERKNQSFKSSEIIPTARTISNHVHDVAKKARSELMPKLIEKLLAGGGALTLDMATSKQQIIAITAHTISESKDNNGQLSLKVNSDILELAIWDVTKRTNQPEVRNFVVNLLSDLNFPQSFFDKVHIVTDEGTPVLNLNDNSICCVAHILNTVAKHIIKPYSKRVKYTQEQKENARIFDKLVSDVKSFLSSARRNTSLKAVLGDIIAVPGETRWLSHLKSLKNIVQKSDTILNCLNNDLYAAANLKPQFNELISKKVLLEAMIKVLEAIEKPLVKLQAETVPTINHVIPALAQLERTLTDFKENSSSTKELSSVATLCLLALQYKLGFLREIDAYAVGVVVDPYLNKLLPKISSSTLWDFEKIKQQVEKAAYRMLNTEPDLIKNLKKQNDYNFDDYGFSDDSIQNQPNVSNEINELLCYKTSMPVLKFWSTCSDDFPILKLLAQRYLSIPATSCSSERVFSAVKLYNNRLRSRLDMELINDMVLARGLLKKDFPSYFS